MSQHSVHVFGDINISKVSLGGKSLSGTQYSKSFTAPGPNFGVHIEFTGSPTTAVTLWKSNKPRPSEANDADWVQDSDVTFTGAAGSAAKEAKEVGNSGVRYYRLKFVTSGGTGRASAWVSREAVP